MPNIRRGMMGAAGAAGGGGGPSAVYSWGRNYYGTLGQGDTVDRSSPTQIGTGNDWAAIQQGYGTSAGIKTDGTLWCWGVNSQYPALGDGTAINRSSPVQIGSLTDWNPAHGKFKIAEHHLCNIKTDGTLWVAGRNDKGQLGDGTTINRSSPVQIGTDTNWSQIEIHQQAAAAIRTDGTLWTWGRNYKGFRGINLGDTAAATISSPVQVGSLTDWRKLAFNKNNPHVIKSDGTLWNWGYANWGSLGRGDSISYSSPVQLGSLTDWAETSMYFYNTVAAKTNDQLWTWGGNGALCNGAANSSPVQISTDTDWQVDKLTCGRNYIVIPKDNHTMWYWGLNDRGQLGIDSVVATSSPAQLGSETDWDAFACGENSTMGLKNT